MKKIKFYILLLTIFLFSQHLSAQSEQHRVIVLTDIEADPDDTQSLVRLLLYSNEIDIKGIVATTSCWKKTSIAPESIKKVIKAYGKVQNNLLKHDPGFPSQEELLSRVKEGLPLYGMLGVGKGKDSEGSDLIIKILEEEDDRPLWISVWGGSNTLAQALFKIENTMSKKKAREMISKLRVYTISDQDDSGIWIRNKFPELFYIVSPGDDYGHSIWNGIMRVVNGIDNTRISNAWLAENIQQGHGPLGNEYPDVAWGMEGDTPAFLSLIQNGLNKPEHPNWGAWGGRYEFYKPDLEGQVKGSSGVPYEPETRKIWTDAEDSYTPFIPGEYGRTIKRADKSYTGNLVSLWRWRDDFQNDFAARMDWCTGSFEECNHAPVINIHKSDEITVKSGQTIGFNAAGTSDPDGDHLSYLWFNYTEAGTLKNELKFNPENGYTSWIRMPEVDKEEEVHIILKVTDKGRPQLCSYKRIVVKIEP